MGAIGFAQDASEDERIRPFVDNPFYWQYEGEPILLVGGTHDDNPFNNPSHDAAAHTERLEDHLELLASAGGNYVRNTMSHRDMMNVYPYLREPAPVRDPMNDGNAWVSPDAEHAVHIDRSIDRDGALSVWQHEDSESRVRLRRDLDSVDVSDGTVEVWFHVRDHGVGDRIDALEVTLESAEGAATLTWPGQVMSGWHVLIFHVDAFIEEGLDPTSVTAVELAVATDGNDTLDEGDVLWDEFGILGRFDLDRFNPEYWDRLRALLDMSLERDLIVQIELWDKVELFDDGSASAHKWDPRRGWSKHPFNPRNNRNYTQADSGLPEVIDWSYHPDGGDRDGDRGTEIVHPFFYTVPSVEDLLPGGDRELNDFGVSPEEHEKLVATVLPFQEAFVAKVLDVAVEYPNVLYAVNNETFLPTADWSDHWARFIHAEAEAHGVSVEVGDMRGESSLEGAPEHAYHHQLARPDLYTFIDVSQNSGRKIGEALWSDLQWIRGAMEELEDGVRPITNTKIYDFTPSSVDVSPLHFSVEKFWRSILGGASSARYHRRMGAALHRPLDGDGSPIEDESNDIGLASFRSAVLLVEAFDLFQARPDNSVLRDRAPGEAYASVGPDASFAVYVPSGADVTLSVEPGRYEVRWLALESASWEDAGTADVDDALPLRTSIERHALAIVHRIDE